MGSLGDRDGVAEKTVINRTSYPDPERLRPTPSNGRPPRSADASTHVMTEGVVLLQHLASFPWFMKHGEVTLTAGLSFCLQKDPAAAAALTELITTRTGTRLPTPERWHAETIQDDRTRVDITGVLDTGDGAAPVLLVEAKVGAAFAPHQISKYVCSQQADLAHAKARGGVLIVLVPGDRLERAAAEIAADLKQPADAAMVWHVDGPAQVSVAVISWDELIRAMQQADGPSVADLDQLLGACRALKGADVLALSESDLANPAPRLPDVLTIIGQVTQQANTLLALKLKPYPWQPNPSQGLAGGYRYLGDGVGVRPELAVGMRVDVYQPLLWVRWHSGTPGFMGIEPRLKSAGHRPERHDGHLWVALTMTPQLGPATEQIANLSAQVVTLFNIAAGEAPSLAPTAEPSPAAPV